MIFFGFAVADSMFQGECTITRRMLSVDKVREFLNISDIQYCLNPSHKATITAAMTRYALPINIPEKPPSVKLQHGDSLIVMSVRGLPRLENSHEYTTEQISGASFEFSMYTVID